MKSASVLQDTYFVHFDFKCVLKAFDAGVRWHNTGFRNAVSVKSNNNLRNKEALDLQKQIKCSSIGICKQLLCASLAWETIGNLCFNLHSILSHLYEV